MKAAYKNPLFYISTVVAALAVQIGYINKLRVDDEVFPAIEKAVHDHNFGRNGDRIYWSYARPHSYIWPMKSHGYATRVRSPGSNSENGACGRYRIEQLDYTIRIGRSTYGWPRYLNGYVVCRPISTNTPNNSRLEWRKATPQ
jgi:hypothetical protein